MIQDENRPMYDVTCADCGQPTQVPFEPTGDRPVYCRECFKKHRQERSGGGGGRDQREMHDAVCADCGQPTQVPFKPTGDRPVYCRECYEKHRDQK